MGYIDFTNHFWQLYPIFNFQFSIKKGATHSKQLLFLIDLLSYSLIIFSQL